MNDDIINKYKLIGWDFFDRQSDSDDTLIDLFGGETNDLYATSPNVGKIRFYVCDKSELTEEILIQQESKYKKIKDCIDKYKSRGESNLPVEFPIRIKSIEYSGGACPYQIEATTEDDRYFYLRYRWGIVKAGVSDTYTTFDQKCYIINLQIGDSYDGFCDEENFKKVLDGKVIFPEGFKFE